MKKIISLFLAVIMTVTMFAGCTVTEPEQTGGNDTAGETALEVLQKVWDRFSDEEKFPVYGGDAENMVDGAPGQFSTTDTDGLMHNLLVPENRLADVDQAASMIHGMMVNNFTCGVFRLKDGTDAASFADAMRTAFKENRWLCGTPEQLRVAVVGREYVIAAFGLGDVLDVFQSRLTQAYPNAQIKYAESIA